MPDLKTISCKVPFFISFTGALGFLPPVKIELRRLRILCPALLPPTYIELLGAGLKVFR
jgi:hypothetical protein